MVDSKHEQRPRSWFKQVVGPPRWWLINVPIMIAFMGPAIWWFDRA